MGTLYQQTNTVTLLLIVTVKCDRRV